jgi:hypothetical protein
MTISHSFKIRDILCAITLGMTALISGCGGDSKPAVVPPVDNTPTTAIFEVTLVNLTAGQPLSPMLAIVHNDSFSLFKEGDVASTALEYIAESGNTAPLAALVADSKSVITSAAGPAMPLLPDPDNMVKVTLTVPLASLAVSRLSFATMLGNTNDGFTGVSGEMLSNLAVNASRNIDLLAYDAGTEANTESADTVPGPATANSGGKREAFNPMRDDIISTIHIHPGIVSKDDGLPTSALTQAQRWDNPVATLKIRRMQ